MTRQELDIIIEDNLTLDGADDRITAARVNTATTAVADYADTGNQYANLAAFPNTGTKGNIYVAIDTGIPYYWSGTVYVPNSGNQSLSISGQSLTLSGGGGTVTIPSSGAGSAYLTVIWEGTESNTAAQGSSSPTTLTTQQKLPRQNTLILNNNNYQVEQYQPTVNGLTAHYNLTDNSHWGIELVIADAVDAGIIQGKVLIVKDGQGGTVISSRLSGAYYTATLAKIQAVKDYCEANNYIPLLVTVQTQGINDEVATVGIEAFKESMRSYRKIVEDRLGAGAWIYTKLPSSISGIAPYNNAIQVLATERPATFVLNSDSWALNQGDPYHWSDSALLLWGNAVVDLIANTFGQDENYTSYLITALLQWQTLRIPSVSGQSGKVIGTNGSALLWVNQSGGGGGDDRLGDNVIYLSKAGILDDADLSDASISFGTDQTSAIQDILNTNDAGGGLTVYWDVKVSISSRLYVNSQTLIQGINGGGLILRDLANDWMFCNKNVSTTTKIDHDISICGLLINGNARNSAYGGASGGYAQEKFNATCSLMTGGVFVGVTNLLLQNNQWVCHRAYNVFINNFEGVVIEGETVRSDATLDVNQDGYHFGTGNDLDMSKLNLYTGDAPIALNADDVPYPVTGGNVYPLTNGTISNVKIKDIVLNGAKCGIVGLSGTHEIRNVEISHISGSCLGAAVFMDNLTYSPNLLSSPGPGYYKNIKVHDIDVDVTADGTIFPHVQMDFFFSANFEGLDIRNIKRKYIYSSKPTIYFYGDVAKTFKNVNVNGLNVVNETNFEVPAHILFANTYQGNRVIVEDFTLDCSFTNDTLIKMTASAVPRVTLNNINSSRSSFILDVASNCTIKNISGDAIIHDSPLGASYKILCAGDDFVLSNYYGRQIFDSAISFTTQRGDAFADTLPVILDPTSLSGYSDIILSANTNLLETNRVITPTTSGSYGHTGLFNKHLPANTDGGFAFKIEDSDAINIFPGLNLSNTNEGFAGYEYSFELASTRGIYPVTNGSANGLQGSVSIGDWIRVNRVGGTIKIQKSSNNGVSWADIHTYSGNHQDVFYINVDMQAGAKMYYPVGINLIS